ncbi:MAG: ATP/GTP-binding protein [Sideroxydans sp.]|nr:ATP/GTP-binding protein [Sideroxydans sp.]
MKNKIIITGAVGSGKTTAITSASDTLVVDTEAADTDRMRGESSKTTVAMDYGTLNLGAGAKMHLFGTPGQERFSYMWEILSTGATGIAILIDATSVNPLGDLDFYLEVFSDLISKCGGVAVIGITHTDVTRNSRILEQFNKRLSEVRLSVPVFEVDCRRREDVRTMLYSLLSLSESDDTHALSH